MERDPKNMQGSPSEHGEHGTGQEQKRGSGTGTGGSREPARKQGGTQQGGSRQGSREGGSSHESDDMSRQRGQDFNEPGQNNPQRLDRNTEDKDLSP